MPSAFDPALFPSLVFLLPRSEPSDGDAGVDESFPDPSGPGLPCVVEAKKVAKHGFAGDQEIGVTPVDMIFPDDPGASKGDRLFWPDDPLDPAGPGRIVRLLAPARPQGLLFYLDGEIRD